MSEKKRRRGRVHSTIDDLPEPLKSQFEVKLANPANTYNELSEWLKGEGYSISKSAIGRYAVRTREAAQRVAETLQRTQAIAQAVEAHPDLDYTKAAELVLIAWGKTTGQETLIYVGLGLMAAFFISLVTDFFTWVYYDEHT